LFGRAKNTKQKGNVGIGVAISHYLSEMCTVSIPINDSQDYDLVVEKGGMLFKVQVKTAESKSKSGKMFRVWLSVQGGNRKKNYISKLGSDLIYDILFVVTSDGERYEIPRSAISHINRVIEVPGKYIQYRCGRSLTVEHISATDKARFQLPAPAPKEA